MKKILLSLISGCFCFLFFPGFSQNIVINEVYGGGGNSGSTYKNDFVELYNPTGSAINLTGWSIQYSAGTGTTWLVTALAGSVPAGSYYLIQQAAGTGGTVNLPAPDAIGTIGMAAIAGKVALVNSTTALSEACPSGYIDLIGYGSAANCFEGSAPAPAPSASVSVNRKVVGQDANQNSTDFQTAAPSPRNAFVQFTTAFPKVQNINSDRFQVVSNLNKPGSTYVVVVPSGATAPASGQVKNGLDATGVAVASNLKATIGVTLAATSYTADISGLSPTTAYDVYFVSENSGYLQLLPTKIGATTLAVLPPIITPSTTAITFVGFTSKNKQSLSKSYSLSAINLVADVSVTVSGNYQVAKDNINFGSSISFPKADFAAGGSQSVYVRFIPNGNIGTLTGTITQISTNAADVTIAISAVAIDPFNQDFNDPDFLTKSGWSQISRVGAQTWTTTNFGRTCLTGCTASTVDKAAQINGYSGSAQTNEDWLISPLLDLDGFINLPILSFWTISAFAGDGLKLKYSTDYVGSGDPTAAVWTDLDGEFPVANSSIWTKSSPIILPKASIYVAFVYSSSTLAASRWTLDDWQLSDEASYIDVPTIAFSYGEISAGTFSSAKEFTFKAIGYGEITIALPAGYEASINNETFSTSLVVSSSEAAVGKKIYVRFSPPSKQLRWEGEINLKGTGLDVNLGSLAGSSYLKSETFDVTTFNLDFFGADVVGTGGEFGPADDPLQIANATAVLQTIGADIYGVQEISNDDSFDLLVSNLAGYQKIISDQWSYSFNDPDPNFPPQKIGFIYNKSTVKLIGSRVMFKQLYNDIQSGAVTLPGYPTGGSATSKSFWSSGRLPFMATFDVTINDHKKRLRAIVIHAKSGSAPADYDRRKYDVQVLRDSLLTNYPNDNIILLGDYNDDVDTSIKVGSESSFKNFVDDVANFNTLTYGISQAGSISFPSANSFLDHIITSNELTYCFIANSIIVEEPRAYITSYSSTTSDHLPVSARFELSIKSEQTITFKPLIPRDFEKADFELSAFSTSGLPVSYTSADPTIVSLNGSKATIRKTGTATIIATQPGDNSYNPAVAVEQSFTIRKANQIIKFDALAPKIFGDQSFTLLASGGLSENEVEFSSSNSSIVKVSGKLVEILKSGVVTITATQLGNENYYDAVSVEQSLTINKAPQKITFLPLPSQSVGDAELSLSAQGGMSGNVLVFTSSNDLVAKVVNDKLEIIGVGICVITCSQAGSDNYFAAHDVSQELTVSKAAQTITFDEIPTRTFGDEAFMLGANSTSGLEVKFFCDNEKVATVVGNKVTIVGAGNASITASQEGNGYYASAMDVKRLLVIDRANQTIVFEELADKTFGDAAFTLEAASSSSLPVTYTSSNLNIVVINGNNATIVGAGAVGIVATQLGNNNFNPATEVKRSLTIRKANQTISFNELPAKTFGNTSFALEAKASSSLPVMCTSSNLEVATINGNVVSIIGAGKSTITAQQNGNENFNATAEVKQILTVSKANQTITFAELPIKTFGDSFFTLEASASSSLPIAYSSSNLDVATIAGKTITVVGAGTSTITAKQPGNDNYNLAGESARTLTVSKAAQTILFPELPSKKFGDASFTFTAVASSGLPIFYTSSNLEVATVAEKIVTIIGAGTATITAKQPGNTNFEAALETSRVLFIGKANQEITFEPIADRTLGDESFYLKAKSNSGLPVTFESSSDKIVLNGLQVNPVKAGRVLIKSMQVGNSNYHAAAPVERSFCIKPPKPIIVLSNLNTRLPVLSSSALLGNQWYLNGTLLVGEMNKQISASASGTYTVQVIADDCKSEFSIAQGLVVTGEIASRALNESVEIFPNPANQVIRVNFLSQDPRREVLIVGITGFEFKKQLVYGMQADFELSDIPPGIYLVKICDSNSVQFIRFVKN